MGEVSVGSEHYSALFGIAVVLLIITLIINLSAVAILRRLKEGQVGRSDRKSLIPASLQEPFKRIVITILIAGLVVFLFTAAPWYLAVAIVLGSCAWYIGRDRLSGKQVEMISFGFIIAAAVAVVAILVIILGYIIVNGFPALSWEFLTQPPRDLGRAGGIFPAIVGALYLVAGRFSSRFRSEWEPRSISLNTHGRGVSPGSSGPVLTCSTALLLSSLGCLVLLLLFSI